MPETISREIRSALTAGIALLAVSTAAEAQRGTIAGRVTDQASGNPVAGAKLQVLGTTATATTAQDGQFTLRFVPAGDRDVRIVAIGYGAKRAQVNVQSGETTTLNVPLAQTVVQLEEIVTTAAGEQNKAVLGHSIGTIRADSVVAYTGGRNVTDLLVGKEAGVQVLSSSGTTGAGTRIRIRGASSVSLTNEPIVFIDGIRVGPIGTASSTLGTGGQAPSRLDDLTPEEIESVEIVKGPSAATLYGTEAANGVLLFRTKRGRPGPARWNIGIEQGMITDANAYPDNYTSFRAGAATRQTCLLRDLAAGACTQDSVTTFNALENAATTSIASGYRSRYNLNVGGGSDAVTYFVSGLYQTDNGTLKLNQGEQDRLITARGVEELPDEVIRPNNLQKTGLRANLTARVANRGEILVSAGYVSSVTRFPQNDNNVLGYLPSGYFGRGSVSDTSSLNANGVPNGGYGFFRAGEIFSLLRKQNVERFTGGVIGNFAPAPWLTTKAVVGYDITNRTDISFDPTNLGPNFSSVIIGNKIDNRAAIKAYTVDVGASGLAQLSRDIRSRTSVGGQYFKDVFFLNQAQGQGLTFGSADIDGAAILTASQTTTDVRTIGVYVEQEFAWRDRLYLVGAVRVDDNSSFGNDFNTIVYPKVSGSYFISEEPWFPQSGVISQLRFRGAYGQSGRQPSATDGLFFVAPTSSAVDNVSTPAVTFQGGGAGLAGLKPERSKELELGFDIALFESRLGIEFTYFNKLTSDALINRILPPSAGGPNQRFENLGSTRNYGIEAAITGQILRTRSFLWEATLAGSLLKNNLRSLGPDVPPILIGNQRQVPNYPLGGYWDRDFSFNDANGDGIIAQNEVVVGDTAVYRGPSVPTREFSFRTSASFGGGAWRIGAQFDYRGGHKLFNNTEAFRCTATGNNCRGIHDPTAPLEEQARAIVRRFHSSQSTMGYIEPADFLKFRELSLSYRVPTSFAGTFGSRGMLITLAGRNLFTITDYTGLDPEVQSAGQNNFTSSDFLTQPQVRTFVFRASLEY